MHPYAQRTKYIYCEAGIVEMEYLDGELTKFHFVSGSDVKLMDRWTRKIKKMTDENIHMTYGKD